MRINTFFSSLCRWYGGCLTSSLRKTYGRYLQILSTWRRSHSVDVPPRTCFYMASENRPPSCVTEPLQEHWKLEMQSDSGLYLLHCWANLLSAQGLMPVKWDFPPTVCSKSVPGFPPQPFGADLGQVWCTCGGRRKKGGGVLLHKWQSLYWGDEGMGYCWVGLPIV